VTCLFYRTVNTNNFYTVRHISTVKMKVIRSSETLVTTYKTTLRHNPEDHSLHLHCRENLRSYIHLLKNKVRMCAQDSSICRYNLYASIPFAFMANIINYCICKLFKHNFISLTIVCIEYFRIFYCYYMFRPDWPSSGNLNLNIKFISYTGYKPCLCT
jgi:hypothetical protein